METIPLPDAMFISRDREKLIQAIVYFVRETRHCHTLKLFKLLNFLDVEHYRQAGRTVTGLEYRALPKGPVPTGLLAELKRGGGADLRQTVAISEERDGITDEILRRDIRPKTDFNPKIFTPRELAIMARLAEFFRELRCDDMSEFSHDRKLPWRKVFAGGKGQGQLINPDLSLAAEPLMHDVPTIETEEVAYRKELLKGTA